MKPSADQELRGATLYAKFIHHLMTVGGTYQELCDYSGLSYHTVIRYIKALRHYKEGRKNLVPVIGWAPDAAGVMSLRVHKMGWGVDVKRPRLSDAERQRRYRGNKLKRHLILQNSIFPNNPVIQSTTEMTCVIE